MKCYTDNANTHPEHQRGCKHGFWLWKPFIIKKTMENMNDGDVLLYLDCGCELDNNKKDDLF